MAPLEDSPSRPGGERLTPLTSGAMDAPTDGGVLVRGTNLVGGWVVDPHWRVRAVQVLVNGYLHAVVRGFHERPDITASFPGASDVERPGWTAELSLERLVSDTAEVEAVAVLDIPGEGREETMYHVFARARCRVTDDSAGRGVGRFLVPASLPAGHQRVYGVADAPGGIARVELTIDGEPAGRARPMLPGSADPADLRPESAVSVFEHVVDLPESDSVTLGGTAVPLAGPSFELRASTVEIIPRRHDEERSSTAVRRAGQRLAARIARMDSSAVAVGEASARPLVVTHDLGFGGAQLYLQELLQRLGRRGVRGAVVTCRGGRYLDELEELGLPVEVVGAPAVDDPDRYEAQVREIATIAREHGCNVALGNTVLAFPGIDAAHRLGLRSTWAVHESFPLDQMWLELFGNVQVSDHVKRRARETLASSAEVVFAAGATRDIYTPLLGGGAAQVVPYGVDIEDIDRYRASHDRAVLRADLGVEPSTLLFLCLGTIEPRKAQVALVQAFSGSTALAGRDVCLALVGALENSPYADAARDLAAAHRDARVRVVPMQADTYQWHAAADLLVCASDVESLPRSILEAMAFETPILSTAVFGVPELITDGDTGFLCPARDVGALRGLLERAASTPPETLRRMGAAARATVLRVHDPAVYENHFHDRLTELARLYRPS